MNNQGRDFHIALVTPDGQPDGTGNQVMARRLAAGLRGRGLRVTVMPAAELAAADGSFDRIHALHVGKAGPAALARSQRSGIPLTVTFTGTDLELDLPDTARRASLIRVLEGAQGIALLHDGMKDILARFFPQGLSRAVVIRQGPALPSPAGRVCADWGIPPEAFVFLLPAGLRAVKRPGYALEPLRSLRKSYPQVHWLLAGPELESEVAAALQYAIRSHPWIQYTGEVSHSELVDLYHCSDVVLNTSAAEGMPNAILEAMSLGRPVLVSDCTGNRTLVESEVDGLVFNSQADFEQQARRLLENPDLLDRLGRAARSKIQCCFRPETEITGYVDLLTMPCRQITLR